MRERARRDLAAREMLDDGGRGAAAGGERFAERLALGEGDQERGVETVARADRIERGGSGRQRGRWFRPPRRWGELTRTLNAILLTERTTARVRLHAPEPDPVLNPGDHDDHRNAGLAARAIASSAGCLTLVRHDGYDTANRAIDVKDDDLLAVVGTWGATTSALADYYAPSTWGNEHNAWLTRQYSREEPASPCI